MPSIMGLYKCSNLTPFTVFSKIHDKIFKQFYLGGSPSRAVVGSHFLCRHVVIKCSSTSTYVDMKKKVFLFCYVFNLKTNNAILLGCSGPLDIPEWLTINLKKR